MHQFITARGLRVMGISLLQQKFIFHQFSLWFSIRGRFNYTNLSRYYFLSERTFRRWFVKNFDWLEFNQRLLTIIISPNHDDRLPLECSIVRSQSRQMAGEKMSTQTTVLG